ncbi:unnamed protein product [Allacma fusca]|uniref:Uncharacterized protein n=1 Tax=Allacma fusca TaxID=39272 RepID=A0A8J2LPE1_9HEXA|nr:unnamed protein product [Allacma fusca]
MFFQNFIFLILWSTVLGTNPLLNSWNNRQVHVPSHSQANFRYEGYTTKNIITGCQGVKFLDGSHRVEYYVIDNTGKKRIVRPGGTIAVALRASPNTERECSVKYSEMCFPAQCGVSTCGDVIGSMNNIGTSHFDAHTASLSSPLVPDVTARGSVNSRHAFGRVTGEGHFHDTAETELEIESQDFQVTEDEQIRRQSLLPCSQILHSIPQFPISSPPASLPPPPRPIHLPGLPPFHFSPPTGSPPIATSPTPGTPTVSPITPPPSSSGPATNPPSGSPTPSNNPTSGSPTPGNNPSGSPTPGNNPPSGSPTPGNNPPTGAPGTSPTPPPVGSPTVIPPPSVSPPCPSPTPTCSPQASPPGCTNPPPPPSCVSPPPPHPPSCVIPPPPPSCVSPPPPPPPSCVIPPPPPSCVSPPPPPPPSCVIPPPPPSCVSPPPPPPSCVSPPPPLPSCARPPSPPNCLAPTPQPACSPQPSPPKPPSCARPPPPLICPSSTPPPACSPQPTPPACTSPPPPPSCSPVTPHPVCSPQPAPPSCALPPRPPTCASPSNCPPPPPCPLSPKPGCPKLIPSAVPEAPEKILNSPPSLPLDHLPCPTTGPLCEHCQTSEDSSAQFIKSEYEPRSLPELMNIYEPSQPSTSSKQRQGDPAALFASLPGAIRGHPGIIYYPSCDRDAFRQVAVVPYCEFRNLKSKSSNEPEQTDPVPMHKSQELRLEQAQEAKN